ncbi:sugar ABC transporter permease [Diaminobutyricibacter tongyongensis]|uniref:Sugar ABC transporter permease n=1 Tax=Leifsonia tongyongensis TaxID=1268043 RepID=A0A6L9XXF9_9MICO|nr:sugar ABC transporter permease [Diaminobutyricibacter tongyongensis]
MSHEVASRNTSRGTVSLPGRVHGRTSVVPARRRRFRPQGYTWVLPALALSVGLIYYCIGYTGYISTLDWNGTAPDPTSVGLANYAKLFADPVFWMAIQHTLLFFVVTFAVQTVLGIVFAAMLHSRPFAGTLYKVVLFVPVVLAPAIMAPVFRQIFANNGQFNWILEHVGLGSLAQPWLAQPSTALWVIMVISIWQWTGMTMILYYAAMSQIEPEVLEAAEMDGAGNIRKLVSIIWPSVRGTTIALATLSAIGSLKTFDIPYLVTTGGPNFATEFLGTMIYRISIPLGQVGYGAAISVMLVIIALVLGIVLNVRKRERGVSR